MTREADGRMEQTILDAAEHLFMEKGFALTSTTEIAEKAGCNQALIHYYFRTKEKLFEAVFEKKIQIFFSNIIEISDKAESFEEILRRAIEAHFDMIRANPQLPFFIVNELITNPARIDAIKGVVAPRIGQLFALMQKWIGEESAKGNIKPMDPFDLIYNIVSLNVAMFLAAPIVTRARDIDDASFERLLDARRKANVELILGSLRP
jgi:TetR/AcrR family transcriptional regulator